MPVNSYDEYGEEIRRLFVPSDDPGRSRIPRTQLVVYNPEKQISQLQFQAMRHPSPSRDETSMVVHVDGACRNNGKPDARASFGVFFGPGSKYNTCGMLPASLPKTSTRAEIEAFAQALDIIKSICDDDFKLMQVKIATDWAFLVNAMSRWIEGWIENDGIGSDGKRIAHFHRLQELHLKLNDMEYGDDGGIEVQFWHVDRRLNQEADALANDAFRA